jgi:galactose-1-phosphate uridylyltransferase
MDRLEEIRQRTEAGRPIRRIDMKYLLSEVDRLNALHKREIIVTGEYAQRVIDLTARAEAAEAERDRAIKQMCRFCKSMDRKAGLVPVCAADCEWRGLQEAGTVKGEAE